MAEVTSKFLSRGGLSAARTSWTRVGIGCLLASVVAGCDGQQGAAGATPGSGGSGPGTGGGAGSGQAGGTGVNPAVVEPCAIGVFA